MADAQLLTLTVLSFTADQLAIKVTNTSGALLDKSMILELTLPKVLVAQRIRNQADLAPRKNPPIATLDNS